MKTRISKVGLKSKVIIPVYGGSKLTFEHYVSTETEQDHTTNEYIVTGEFRGEQNPLDFYYSAEIVEATTNNQNTLTAEALLDLLEWDYTNVEFKQSETN